MFSCQIIELVCDNVGGTNQRFCSGIAKLNANSVQRGKNRRVKTTVVVIIRSVFKFLSKRFLQFVSSVRRGGVLVHKKENLLNVFRANLLFFNHFFKRPLDGDFIRVIKIALLALLGLENPLEDTPLVNDTPKTQRAV